MKSFVSAFAALALALPVFGAPTVSKLTVKRSPTGSKPDSFIVVLKATEDKKAHLDALQNAVSVLGGPEHVSQIIYDDEYSFLLNGYNAILKGGALDHVLSDPAVAYVEEDGLIQLDAMPQERELTHEERSAAEEHTKTLRALQARAGGANVTVYGIDTGIFIAHNDFGGRASWGKTFGGYPNKDGNGHGTHTAATAVGTKYGVATSAKVVAVKVLSDSGSGTNADVVAGMNWAAQAAVAAGNPSVLTMSLGGSVAAAVDDAVATATSKGIHFTVAAGNSNADANGFSPARAPTANTIGAVDSTNKKASFSNYGKLLDVWAPGVNILSAWIGSPDATNTISGTSMATPFVAGILAVVLGEEGSKTPAALSAELVSHARPLVRGAPTGTTNLLATLW